MNNRLVQRFVLATLYYSTDGMNSWTHQDRWLDYETHECEWYHRASSTSFTLSLEQTNSYEYYKDTMVHCDNDGMLRHLWMVKNNLRGSLPAELFLLSSLQSISMEKNPGLTAQIPSQLGLLSDLAVLFLDNNNHTGSGTYLSCGQKRKIMPKFTCNWSGEQLFYSSSLCWFLKKVPSELGALSYLEKVFLHNNKLTGSLPSEIGRLAALSYSNLEKNAFTGR